MKNVIARAGAASTNSSLPVCASTKTVFPRTYSFGMIAGTLDNFLGRYVVRYFEKVEQRSSFHVWPEGETSKLIKFKLAVQDTLSFCNLKTRIIGKFFPTELPGENQVLLSCAISDLRKTLSPIVRG